MACCGVNKCSIPYGYVLIALRCASARRKVTLLFMLKFCDVLPKTGLEDVRGRVHTGVQLKLLFFASVALLVGLELRRMFVPVVRSGFRVENDFALSRRRVFVNFNMTIDQDCSNIHVDMGSYDGLGDTDVVDGVTKVRLPVSSSQYHGPDANGSHNSCGSCYGFADNSSCCNSCWDLIRACEASGALCYGFDKYSQCRNEEFVRQGHSKCMVFGHVKVQQSKGSFHIGIGNNINSTRRHNISKVLSSASLTHTIHYFEFGPSLPGFTPPLRNISGSAPRDSVWALSYYMHVVPTTWGRARRKIQSFQYTVAYSQRNLTSPLDKWVPGIHYHYEFFPIHLTTELTLTTRLTSIVHITRIIGYLFSFTAAIDACVASIPRTRQSRHDLTKCL